MMPQVRGMDTLTFINTQKQERVGLQSADISGDDDG